MSLVNEQPVDFHRSTGSLPPPPLFSRALHIPPSSVKYTSRYTTMKIRGIHFEARGKNGAPNSRALIKGRAGAGGVNHHNGATPFEAVILSPTNISYRPPTHQASSSVCSIRFLNNAQVGSSLARTEIVYPAPPTVDAFDFPPGFSTTTTAPRSPFIVASLRRLRYNGSAVRRDAFSPIRLCVE